MRTEIKEDFAKVSDKTEEKGLSAFGASLAILSTIIGGGVVGLPYSFYQTGIPLGVFSNIVFAFLTFYSCVLYLKARNMVGSYVQ